MAVVTFDPSVFRNRYREFAAVETSLLQAYFNEACVYCSNASTSMVSAEVRGTILNMITAHIAELANTPIVGRVSNVSVGGITTGTAYAPAAGTRAWFDQTKYGAAAWAAMSPFRRAYYVGPQS